MVQLVLVQPIVVHAFVVQHVVVGAPCCCAVYFTLYCVVKAVKMRPVVVHFDGLQLV